MGVRETEIYRERENGCKRNRNIQGERDIEIEMERPTGSERGR